MPEVKFMDGPLRQKKMLVKDINEPIIAYKKNKQPIWFDNIYPSTSIIENIDEKVEYEWSARHTTEFRDRRPSKEYYEMRVVK